MVTQKAEQRAPSLVILMANSLVKLVEFHSCGHMLMIQLLAISGLTLSPTKATSQEPAARASLA